MQLSAMAFQPGLGVGAAGAQRVGEAPKARRVVVLDQMGDLVCGDIIEHRRRRQDQPPGKR